MGTDTSERQPSGARLLRAVADLTLYAPVGLVVSVIEDMPELVDKGRGVLGQRLNNARFAGKFAVDLGTSRIKRSLRSDTGSLTPSSVAASNEARSDPLNEDMPIETASAQASNHDGEAAQRHATRDHPDRYAALDLAIPGYSALSASQVVARLENLEVSDLRAILAYELATRGRRTIIGRAEQLIEAISNAEGP